VSEDPPDPEPQASDHVPKEWDQDVADAAIGKTLLVGITRIAADGQTVLEQHQYYGKVIRAQRGVGIDIECAGVLAGEVKSLPPDMIVFAPARPGEYRLRSTGEVVTDPDLVTTWTMREKSPDIH
jgi:hypothetical protein